MGGTVGGTVGGRRSAPRQASIAGVRLGAVTRNRRDGGSAADDGQASITLNGRTAGERKEIRRRSAYRRNACMMAANSGGRQRTCFTRVNARSRSGIFLITRRSASTELSLK